MKTQQLETLQPIVMTILENALAFDRLAHAYLFTGEKGTCKMECALWLAGKIVNRNTDEQSEQAKRNIQRIEQGTYGDLVILDGTTKSIKKDEVLSLQEKFSKTALEAAGVKIYILNNVDNATGEACNSLLKFLEEPSDDTFAILISDKQDNVLETLVSRCQTLSFKTQPAQLCYQECLEKGMDPMDSYCLSHLVHNSAMALEISESECYKTAVQIMKGFVYELIKDPSYALYLIQKDGYKDKEREAERETMLWLIDLLYLFYRDCCCASEPLQGWYKTALDASRKENLPFETLCMILLEQKDKCHQVSYNLELIIDEMILKMKEVIQWKK